MIGSMLSTMANAQKLSIQQIQKGVQDGTIPSYVGIPLIEQKTKQMQQAAAALQGQQSRNQPPIAEQVMQAADQVTRPEVPPASTLPATDRQQPAPNMGIASAPSNMPTQYAGGGIVAFTNEGLVNLDNSGSQETIPGGDRDQEARIAAGLAGDAYARRIGLRGPDSIQPTTPTTPTDTGTLARIVDGPNASAAKLQMPARPKISLGPAPGTSSAGPKYDITRGPEATPSPTPQTPAPSAFSGVDDLIKSQLEGSRASREDLRNLILGQGSDRAKRSNEVTGNALTQAGLGIMAGRSPWAMTNIGEGAMRGAEAYGKGIEQLNERDDRIVQQLVSFGLKGEELDNAAAKLGVDLAHYRAQEPYMQSMTAKNLADAGMAPAQIQSLMADIAYKTAEANKATVETGLLPGKAETERAKALRGDAKPPSDKLLADLRTERESAIREPLTSDLDLDPQTRKALSLPGTPSYDRAKELVRQKAYERYNQALRERNYAAGYMG